MEKQSGGGFCRFEQIYRFLAPTAPHPNHECNDERSRTCPLNDGEPPPTILVWEQVFRMKLLRKLKPFDRKSGNLNVVIDTPKGSRNKYAFDFKLNAYKLKAVLPHGTVFPFDFGSIPGTIAEDGDPLDVLVLLDEPVFIGCLVEARLLGVIEAKQTENGKTERNDRLIAVAAESHTNGTLKSLQKLDSKLISEIEHFFVSYNEARGKKFEPTARKGPAAAKRLIRNQTRNRR